MNIEFFQKSLKLASKGIEANAPGGSNRKPGRCIPRNPVNMELRRDTGEPMSYRRQVGRFFRKTEGFGVVGIVGRERGVTKNMQLMQFHTVERKPVEARHVVKKAFPLLARKTEEKVPSCREATGGDPRKGILTLLNGMSAIHAL